MDPEASRLAGGRVAAYSYFESGAWTMRTKNY